MKQFCDGHVRGLSETLRETGRFYFEESNNREDRTPVERCDHFRTCNGRFIHFLLARSARNRAVESVSTNGGRLGDGQQFRIEQSPRRVRRGQFSETPHETVIEKNSRQKITFRRQVLGSDEDQTWLSGEKKEGAMLTRSNRLMMPDVRGSGKPVRTVSS